MAAVRLEPFSEAHLDAVEGFLGDPDVLRFTRVPEPVPPGFARRWLARYEAARRDGTGEAFAAIGPEGEFLGLALAPHIDREEGETELGYVVVPAGRGRGVGTEILRVLTEWAFEAGALRVILIVDVENAASQRMAERCGYVREGVMRSLHFKQGRRIDAVLYSRLPSDPPAE